MSGRFKRVNQWLLFARQWHVIDANHQDINKLTKKVAEHLSGKYKPFWDRETDCGDHVVVLNTQHVAMHAFDWKQHLFLFNRGYPKSKNELHSYQIHEFDPCRMVWMFTYKKLKEIYFNSLPTRSCLERIHLFPETEIPEFVRKNLGNQLELVQSVPKKSTEYSAEERAKFPRVIRKPKDHVLDWEAPEDITEEDYRLFLVELEKAEEAEKAASKPLQK